MQIKERNPVGRGAAPVDGGTTAAPRAAPGLAAASRAPERDGTEAPRVSLAALTGAVASRRTYAETYRSTYVAPAPNVVQVQSSIQLEDVQRALGDARVPKLNVSIAAHTVTVDGLALVFEPTANGARITGTAVNLQPAVVEAAVKKLASLATTAKTLAFLDANAQVYGQPQVVLHPDGRISVSTVASVRVNPKLESQAQSVLDQHQGGLSMPQQSSPAARKAGRRTQVVG